MPSRMEIDAALAELEAGRFSFRMVDAIKDHVGQLESELTAVNAQHDDATKRLMQQEYAINRLEGDLRKANARMHALVKANALTELTVRETKKGAVMVRDYLPVVRTHAIALSKKALTFLAHLDLKAEADKLKAHPMAQKPLAWFAALDLQAEWTKLKTHPLMEKALREAQPAIAKAVAMAKEYLPVAQKQASALIDKTSAYIAQLQKKTA